MLVLKSPGIFLQVRNRILVQTLEGTSGKEQKNSLAMRQFWEKKITFVESPIYAKNLNSCIYKLLCPSACINVKCTSQIALYFVCLKVELKINQAYWLFFDEQGQTVFNM